MKNIKDIEVTGKKILVRCDFNVPIDEKGNILDDFRIKQTLPTLQYLLDNNAKIILITHMGEPEGKPSPELQLDNVKIRLEELLAVSILKTDDCVGQEVQEKVKNLKDKEILLLENVRFHKEETDNDENFAKELASLGEVYVNDAFSDCHRAHASMVGIPKLLPACMGLLLKKEIDSLTRILENPEKPMIVLVGGKKVATKSAFIEKISEHADTVLVSGLIEKEIQDQGIHFAYAAKIIGPTESLEAKDLDPKAVEVFKEKIATAKTVVWNGPFGKFEDEEYKKGTLELANAIIESGAYSVVGGGETVEFLHKEGMIDKFSHVSTGGGAMLSFLTGEELPGLKALE